MAAIANVVLGDGASPTVNHTYKPASINGPLATWVDATRSDGKPAGFSLLTLSNTPPSGNSKVYKVRLKLVIPYSDDLFVDPANVYSTTTEVTFLLPTRSDQTQRLDALAMIASAFVDPQVISAVGDLENVY